MIFQNVARLCEERGISIAALEREVGIGNGIIARWKTSNPSITNAKKVADYFGITIEDLMGGG